ncbi:MAG: DMT family transporter [Proteobacteria bacterium]|nr:DMT family transporter [Pseudomonadota bacterium]
MTAPTEAEARAVLIGNLSLFLSVVIWASMLPVTEILLRQWDPISLAVVRLGAACLILNIAFVVTEGPAAYFRTLPWRAIWMLGASGIGVSTLFLIFGIAYSNAIIAGIIVTSGPVIGALLAKLMMGLPFRPGLWVGIALAVAGGLVMALGKVSGDAGFRGGELLILVGITLWLAYSIGVQQRLKGLSQLGITALTSLTGVAVLCGLAAIALGSGLIEQRMSLDMESVVLMAYLACGPAALSILLWHFGVSRAGVTVASMYSNLTPAVVVLIAMTYGSYPTWWHLGGGVLILAGVLYVQLRPRLDRRRAERKETR